jgi:integrase/recombinase XerD
VLHELTGREAGLLYLLFPHLSGLDLDRVEDAHATELINSGVSIEVVRRRLGHASTETTQVYTLLADKVADAEIRAARCERETGRR